MYSRIKSILYRVKPVFKAGLPVLYVVIFLLINAAIWWAGPWLNIDGAFPLESVTSRLIASVMFSLLWLAVWGVMQWRKLKVYHEHQARERHLEQDPIQRFEERQEEVSVHQ